MGYQRAGWHSGLTYHQECYECKTPVDYTDYQLGFRPWFADGFVYCPKCKTPLRHNEKYAVNAPEVKQPVGQEVPVWEIPSTPVAAKPAPAVVESAPGWEEPAPVVVESAPVWEEPAPAVVESAPVWEEQMVEPVYEAPVVSAVSAPVAAVVPEEEEIPRFCSRCGKAFRDDDFFCSRCGTKRVR